ncbi:DUF6894 family protein [Pararhizobium haloflavum]|uniref:DUF6894 family protein n=1 Tax=Pararhizobium haloflavum TaxID=2037914 RepID=UPI000C17B57F|nr:hypothetical protein [Pararhizobium haloflavum]
MPIYYFDTIEDTELFPDDEGVELQHADEAEAMARHALADLIRERLLDNHLGSLVIEIRDEQDEPLARFVLTSARVGFNRT